MGGRSAGARASVVTEELKVIKPIGRVRRIIGFFLLILGMLVIARDVWLGVWYWPAFGAEERIRFAFWLWAGGRLLAGIQA
jgi:hypothetical protein